MIQEVSHINLAGYTQRNLQTACARRKLSKMQIFRGISHRRWLRAWKKANKLKNSQPLSSKASSDTIQSHIQTKHFKFHEWHSMKLNHKKKIKKKISAMNSKQHF